MTKYLILCNYNNGSSTKFEEEHRTINGAFESGRAYLKNVMFQQHGNIGTVTVHQQDENGLWSVEDGSRVYSFRATQDGFKLYDITSVEK